MLSLQGADKRFGDGIIVAASGATHALQTADALDQGLLTFAAILRLAIEMKDQS